MQRFSIITLPALSLALLSSFSLQPNASAKDSTGNKSGKEQAKSNSPRLRELDFAPFGSALATFSKKRAAEIDGMVSNNNVSEVQQKMKSGAVTSVELTLYFLQRIKHLDGNLRSFIELNPKCLEEATRADQLRASGKVLGPLHGIPVNLKDNIGTAAPMHTTAGAEILLNNTPTRDAPLVSQLRAAGAVILGKASLSEFAGAITTNPTGSNAVSGKGVNPYNPSFEVLGSSSGSAISCSANLTFLSVGSETSGSIVAPAAINGVVGMKPSLNLVSGEGIVPLIRFQDSAGPVTRNVTDAAVLLAVIDSADVDYTTALDAKALTGVSVGVLIDRTDKENLTWLKRIDEGLNKAKANSRDLKMNETVDILPVLFLGEDIDMMGYLKTHGAPVETIEDLLKYNEAEPKRRIPCGQNMLAFAASFLKANLAQNKIEKSAMASYYEELALKARKAASIELDKAFESNHVEVLISLANRHSMIYATAGYPAITVPLGLNEKGEPNGATFIGKQGADAKLLAFAYAFEQSTKYRMVPKPSE